MALTWRGVRSNGSAAPALLLPLIVSAGMFANLGLVTTSLSIVHTPLVTVISPLSPSVTLPGVAGATHVPSARRKLTVPPPEAGTTPAAAAPRGLATHC